MNKYKHRLLTLTLIMLCAGIEFFGVQAYAFASQSIMTGLDLSRTQFALVSTVYTVACILAIFQQQWLTERFGYRKFLLYSLLLYLIATLACTQAVGLVSLGVARFIQGLGGGALFLSSRLMINVLLDEQDFFTGIKWMSHGILLVPVLAPLATGWTVSLLGWQGMFYLLALMILPAMLLAPMALKFYRPTDLSRGHSPIAALAFACAVFALEFTIQEYGWLAAQPRWLHVLVLAMIVLGALGFLYAQRNRVKWLEPGVINSRAFLVGGLLTFMFYLLIVQFHYVMPVFASSQGLSWQEGGGLITLFNLCAYGCFHLYSRAKLHLTSTRAWTSIGALGMGLGCLLMYAFAPAKHYVWYLLPLALQSGFAVFVIIPLSIHMLRDFTGSFYSHGYRTRLIMGKVAASLAITSAAVPIQHRVSDWGMSLFAATREQFLVMAALCVLFLIMINIQRTLK